MVETKATRISLTDFRSAPMRAFHVTWVSFFLCFFGWFGVAPLMAVIREELSLTQTQIGNIIIASVAVTVFARIGIGYVCDRIGPRRAYAGLLVLGAIPVMSIGFADDYTSFLLFRLAIGTIGASFVITQYHTSLMFAPNVVGTANATTAGWGNLGGGVAQLVMPMLFAALLSAGVDASMGWRLTMVVPGVAMLVLAVVYLRVTQDYPEGNHAQLAAEGRLPTRAKESAGSLRAALTDHRVWALFVVYGACFGVELTINNIAAIYFHDSFGLSVAIAGVIASLFGLMNLFARTLGGFFGDKFGMRFGLRGRVYFLAAMILCEGLALMLFSRMTFLPLAVGVMIVFSLFVQMAEGATFSVVPFVNKKALGAVSGLVGAGGNIGAVAAGFLMRSESLSIADALLYMGITIVFVSTFALAVRFSPEAEAEAEAEEGKALPGNEPLPAQG